jgi:peptidoglycan/xylan/chitin deacetylase (PgdA/CDA1 family)
VSPPSRRVAKAVVARLAGAPRHARTLCLHRISEEADAAACSRTRLSRALERAEGLGLHVRPLVAVEARVAAAAPAPYLGLVFDDACASAHATIMAMADDGVPITVAVPTAILDPGGAAPGLADDPMTLAQVRALVDRGVDIVAHGHGHRSFPQMGDDELRVDVRRSLDAVARLTGQPADRLVLPYGAVDRRVAAVLADEGVRIAHGLGRGAVRPGTDPLDLPRLCLSNVTPQADFEFGFSRAYDIVPRSSRGRP